MSVPDGARQPSGIGIAERIAAAGSGRNYACSGNVVESTSFLSHSERLQQSSGAQGSDASDRVLSRWSEMLSDGKNEQVSLVGAAAMITDALRPSKEAAVSRYDSWLATGAITNWERVFFRLASAIRAPVGSLEEAALAPAWALSPRCIVHGFELAFRACRRLGLLEEARGFAEAIAFVAARAGESADRELGELLLSGVTEGRSPPVSRIDGSLLSRRLGVESAQDRIARAVTEADFLREAAVLAGDVEWASRPLECAAGDVIVVQAIVPTGLRTLIVDEWRSRIVDRPIPRREILGRILSLRTALAGRSTLTEVVRLAEALAQPLLHELPAVAGTLHYCGLGPLARVPLNVLPWEDGFLGRDISWVRAGRPSRTTRRDDFVTDAPGRRTPLRPARMRVSSPAAHVSCEKWECFGGRPGGRSRSGASDSETGTIRGLHTGDQGPARLPRNPGTSLTRRSRSHPRSRSPDCHVDCENQKANEREAGARWSTRTPVERERQRSATPSTPPS